MKNLDIHKLTAFITSQLHLKGLHGGGYNTIVANFIAKNKAQIKKNPMFLIGFCVGILDKSGLGNAAMNAARY